MKPRPFKVGDAIKYVPAPGSVGREAQDDIGKIGEIVSISLSGNRVRIYLPKSSHFYSIDVDKFLVDSTHFEGKRVTWNTDIKNIKHLHVKGQQLLFDFYEK